MSEQQPTGGSESRAQRARPARSRTFRLMEIAALLDACGQFVAQLDAHQVGAVIVLCIFALAAVSVWVFAFTVTRCSARKQATRESEDK